MTADIRALVHRAAEAHTNLNILASVISILEGGNIYQVGRIDKAVGRIIAICKEEGRRQLRVYDDAAQRIEKERGQ